MLFHQILQLDSEEIATKEKITNDVNRLNIRRPERKSIFVYKLHMNIYAKERNTLSGKK